MISPHGRVREWALFILALDADRERRAKGVPERERERHLRRPATEHPLLASMRATVQAHTFNGG